MCVVIVSNCIQIYVLFNQRTENVSFNDPRKHLILIRVREHEWFDKKVINLSQFLASPARYCIDLQQTSQDGFVRQKDAWRSVQHSESLKLFFLNADEGRNYLMDSAHLELTTN